MKIRMLLVATALAALCPAADVSPFYLPIRNNDLATLRQLIREPGPTARDAQGNSPLMYAAALGSVDGMRLLLDRMTAPGTWPRERWVSSRISKAASPTSTTNGFRKRERQWPRSRFHSRPSEGLYHYERTSNVPSS